MSISDPTFFGVEALNREVKVVTGRVSLGSSAAPTIAEGLGFSVAKETSPNGTYTLTLDKTYDGLLFAGVEFHRLATSDIIRGSVKAHTVTSSKTVTVEFYEDDGTTGVPALHTPSDNTEFTFCLLLRDGDVS